jgi:hypothetical protein
MVDRIDDHPLGTGKPTREMSAAIELTPPTLKVRQNIVPT